MFGKIMSISDELMMKYYTLLTDEDLDSMKQMHPKEAKLKLAEMIITQYHSNKAAKIARDEFESVFAAGEFPRDIPVFIIKERTPIIKIITESGLSQSGNATRILIRQGAVELNNERIKDENFIVDSSGILKIGSRRFLNIKRQ